MNTPFGTSFGFIQDGKSVVKFFTAITTSFFFQFVISIKDIKRGSFSHGEIICTTLNPYERGDAHKFPLNFDFLTGFVIYVEMVELILEGYIGRRSCSIQARNTCIRVVVFSCSHFHKHR